MIEENIWQIKSGQKLFDRSGNSQQHVINSNLIKQLNLKVPDQCMGLLINNISGIKQSLSDRKVNPALATTRSNEKTRCLLYSSLQIMSYLYIEEHSISDRNSASMQAVASYWINYARVPSNFVIVSSGSWTCSKDEFSAVVQIQCELMDYHQTQELQGW